MARIELDHSELLGFRLDGQQNGAKIADVIKGAKIADVIKGAKIGETEKINIVRGAKIGGGKPGIVAGAKVGITLKD